MTRGVKEFALQDVRTSVLLLDQGKMNRDEAIRLAIAAGCSYRAVAREAGLSPGGVHHIVHQKGRQNGN
jgi:DNA-binding NarL/FixJ family response regulator